MWSELPLEFELNGLSLKWLITAVAFALVLTAIVVLRARANRHVEIANEDWIRSEIAREVADRKKSELEHALRMVERDAISVAETKRANARAANLHEEARAANLPKHPVVRTATVFSFGQGSQCIYLYSYEGMPDRIKVGMTARPDPVARVAEQISTSSPGRINIRAIFFTEDAASLERIAHQALAAHQIKGGGKEWFNVKLQEACATIMREGGDLIPRNIPPDYKPVQWSEFEEED